MSDNVNMLTVEDGIRLQSNDLMRWKQVLKPESFQQLQSWALDTNKYATTGYEVCRGIRLDEYVVNMKNERMVWG